VGLIVIGAAWWYLRPRPPPAAHAPMSIVISDFGNMTGDATFNGSLEPVMKLSLENANFITAYLRSDLRRSLGVAAPEHLDEQAARALAVKQGLGVVVSGVIERSGTEYRLSATATQAVTGKVIARARGHTDQKARVLSTLAA